MSEKVKTVRTEEEREADKQKQLEIRIRVMAYMVAQVPTRDIIRYIQKEFGKKISPQYIYDQRRHVPLQAESGVILKPLDVTFPNASNPNHVSYESSSSPGRLLIDARVRIADRLRDDAEARDLIKEAGQRWMRDEITAGEFIEIVKINKRLSVADLVAIAKEMYVQKKQDDEADPVGANASRSLDKPRDAKELVKMLKKAGVTSIERLVFEKGED